MSAINFVHEIEIGVAPRRLHSFLCDLHNYVPLHPLIESIEEISPPKGMPRARCYRVVDRIPLGPFKIRTVYTAVLDPVTEHEVHGHAWQSLGIRLDTVYLLEEVASGTHLVEKVSVFAPRILRGFVVSQARKSHAETLAKMKAWLQGEGASGSVPKSNS